jgi:cytidine deaminase
MSDGYQTTVSNTGSQRSAEKVRNLSPEQLDLALPEDTESSDSTVSWEELQKEAVSSAEQHSDGSEGSAVLDSNGDVHTGFTLETPSRIIHAPEIAIISAVADGLTTVDKAVVYTDDGENLCGSCRQLLYEFSDGNAEIRLSNSLGETEQYDIEELLPH